MCLAASCATPGEECLDSFDCLEGEFCEPTLGTCLPQPAGPLCELRPEFVTFEPAEEWRWEGWSGNPAFKQVQSTPAVADIDNDGFPEVVTGAYGGGSSETDTMLIVLNGVDGTEKLTKTVAEYDMKWGTGAALGNMDDDPELEIVIVTDNKGLVVLEHDGTEKWATAGEGVDPSVDVASGYPALGNLDADPEPEVLIGGKWFDNDGSLLQDKGDVGKNGEWSMSALADIDGDGMLDIVGGKFVYDANGEVIWESEAPDGFVAVADMNGDASPEVVTISQGRARVLTGPDGAVIFDEAIPGGGTGGAPTVADFDGDGRPEFAAAGEGNYAVYDLDCVDPVDLDFCATDRDVFPEGILWSIAVQDLSSSVTGSSVFDFEGDGRAEVIYNDECHLYVLSGEDGTELIKRENSSRTAAEYPLIVDVDADGNSEFIVPANDDKIGRDDCDVGTFGLFAFGDLNDKWVRTRQVWNQHTYHVTNVEASGNVPVQENDSWSASGLNNYRQNVQGAGIFNAPDLSVAGLSLNLSSCPTQIGIQAQVSNTGSLGVQGGVPVGFYEGIPPSGSLLGFEYTTAALLPGQSETLVLDFVPDPGDIGPWDFYVLVDDEAAGLSLTLECGEDNNQGSLGAGQCIVVQ